MVKTRRFTVMAELAVGGGALAVGAWVGGQPYLALMLAVFYVIAGAVAYLWSRGKGDVAAIMRVSGDERQRMLDVRATAFSGLVMTVFCISGAVLDLARGGTGSPWALVCAVGGAAYIVALAVLRLRH